MILDRFGLARVVPCQELPLPPPMRATAGIFFQTPATNIRWPGRPSSTISSPTFSPLERLAERVSYMPRICVDSYFSRHVTTGANRCRAYGSSLVGGATSHIAGLCGQTENNDKKRVWGCRCFYISKRRFAYTSVERTDLCDYPKFDKHQLIVPAA